LGAGCTITTNVNTNGQVNVGAGAVLHATGDAWVSDGVDVEGAVTFDGDDWRSGWLEGYSGGSLSMPNATKFNTDGMELLSGTNFSYGGTDMTLSGFLMFDSGGPYDFSGKNLTLTQGVAAKCICIARVYLMPIQLLSPMTKGIHTMTIKLILAVKLRLKWI
jgi:hypothetical protein